MLKHCANEADAGRREKIEVAREEKNFFIVALRKSTRSGSYIVK